MGHKLSVFSIFLFLGGFLQVCLFCLFFLGFVFISVFGLVFLKEQNVTEVLEGILKSSEQQLP